MSRASWWKRYCPREQHPGQWNTAPFLAEVNSQFGIDAKAAGADPAALNHDQLSEATAEAVQHRYEEKEKQFSPDLLRWLERRIILDVVDTQWKDHLLSLDHLKEGIGLRGYGQKDPLVEFKKEAFILFEDMMARIDNETVRYLYHVQIQQGEPSPGSNSSNRRSRNRRHRGKLRRLLWPVRPRGPKKPLLRFACSITGLRPRDGASSGTAADEICSTRQVPRRPKRRNL